MIKSNPIVTDKEYDDLKKDILLLERNIHFLIQKIHHQKVGFKPSKNFKKAFIEFQCYLWQMLLEEKI